MSLTEHGLARLARPHPTAAIAYIAGPEAAAVAGDEDLARWRRLTPSAAWAFAKLAVVSRACAIGTIATLVDRRRLPSTQLILFGTGEAGRLLFELVLEGALDCAGVLAVDIPSHRLPFRANASHRAFRLVLHRERIPPVEDSFLHQLQGADLDQRIIALGPAAANNSRAIASAAEAFLLELVATVGRQGSVKFKALM